MTSLITTLLSNDSVTGVSKATKASDSNVQSVLNAALPLLLNGAKAQSEDESTAESFANALLSHGQKDTSNLTSFLKNVDLDDGAKIVKHLLGTSTEEVAAKAKKKSGLDTRTILKIMAILAPLLMSQMGKEAKKETEKSDSGDMSGVVGKLLDNVDVGDVIKIANILLK